MGSFTISHSDAPYIIFTNTDNNSLLINCELLTQKSSIKTDFGVLLTSMMWWYYYQYTPRLNSLRKSCDWIHSPSKKRNLWECFSWLTISINTLQLGGYPKTHYHIFFIRINYLQSFLSQVFLFLFISNWTVPPLLKLQHLLQISTWLDFLKKHRRKYFQTEH